MIFLAVSMVLFISAWGLIGGKQQKVQFTEGMKELQSKIQSVISDVNNGYFKNANDLQCNVDTAGGNTIQFGATSTPPTSPFGSDIPYRAGRPYVVEDSSTNKDNAAYYANCTFFGEAIQFGDDVSSDHMIIHTLLANATFNDAIISGGTGQRLRVDTLRPEYLRNNLVLPTAIPSFMEDYRNPWGIKYVPSSLANDAKVNTIVFIGGFGLASVDLTADVGDTLSNKEGGALVVTPVAMPFNRTLAQSAHAVELILDDPQWYVTAVPNPPALLPFNKTTACFTDGSRKASIVFAKSDNGQLTTELQYNPDPTKC